MQNWDRLYSYIHEYQRLVLDYYSKHGVAFLTTYWNINKDETIWDKEQMFGGSYERTGKLTGIKFDKYLTLPVYFAEEISVNFDGQETGLNKDQETSIIFPYLYGITPYAGDIVKMEQQFLQPKNDTYPLFKVTGVEVYPNTEKRYWKLKLKVYESKNVEAIDDQVVNKFVFFEYDKKIHTLEGAKTLARMLAKDEELKLNLVDMWNDNSGLLES